MPKFFFASKCIAMSVSSNSTPSSKVGSYSYVTSLYSDNLTDDSNLSDQLLWYYNDGNIDSSFQIP